jgi:hypothetical protein
MTEAAAKRSLEVARRRAARFRHLRNLWRVKVRRRAKRLKQVRADQPHLNGNLVEGGNIGQRVAYLFEVAPPIFRLYYSEAGKFATFRWAAHNVDADEWRSDCSSWCRNVALCVSAGSLPALDAIAAGTAVYTGWFIDNCLEVDRRYAETYIGTAVVYGDGTGFHMGLSRADGEATVEHGTPNLDYGTFNEFGAGTTVRFFKFLT